jgi:flagellar basal body rod protein FlgG
MSSAEWLAQDSLHHLDMWIAALNSQAAGTALPGYKADDISFGGGITKVLRQAGDTLQIGEQSIKVNRSIKFSQGDLSSSDKRTHLAIRGEGFFLLNNQSGTGNDYLTRNGELHVDAQGYLIHTSGLYLYDPASNERVWDDSNGGTPPNAFDVLFSDFLAAKGGSLIFVPDKENLVHTSFGVTIFNYTGASTSVGLPTDASIATRALETANTSLQSIAPELVVAQRTYDMISKVLSMRKSSFDQLAGLIR